MRLNLDHIGQIGLAVADVDRAEAFFAEKLCLRKLYRFGDLTFFDCAGVRSVQRAPDIFVFHRRRPRDWAAMALSS